MEFRGTPLELLTQSRSFLFVPGNRPERFDKALRSGADAIVIDLEDSVPTQTKRFARETISNAWDDLRQRRTPVLLRINSPESDAGLEDLAWLSELPPPPGVMIPKVESSDSLNAANASLSNVPLLPIIESAAGYAALSAIAGASPVVRLVIGHLDFVADSGMQCSEDEHELNSLRFAVCIATRLNKLAPAIDGVTVATDDDARLRRDTQRALRFGFGGKLCIHPRQVPIVHDALAPSSQDLEWARRVISANERSGGAPIQLDGRMVDLPVVLQARRTIARARRPAREPTAGWPEDSS